MKQCEENLSVNAPADIDADFVMVFEGDGMRAARIHDGDMVFIKETTDVKDGDIVMVLVDGKYWLRKYQSGSGDIQYLLPDADGVYPSFVIAEGQTNAVIIGKAVAVLVDIK